MAGYRLRDEGPPRCFWDLPGVACNAVSTLLTIDPYSASSVSGELIALPTAEK